MDFYRWIYSKDVAAWVEKHPPSVQQQAGCILSAPHRTLKEKLKGLQELCFASEDRTELEAKIAALSSIVKGVCSDTTISHCFYDINLRKL